MSALQISVWLNIFGLFTFLMYQLTKGRKTYQKVVLGQLLPDTQNGIPQLRAYAIDGNGARVTFMVHWKDAEKENLKPGDEMSVTI